MNRELIGVIKMNGEINFLPDLGNSVQELKQNMEEMFGDEAEWLYALNFSTAERVNDV